MNDSEKFKSLIKKALTMISENYFKQPTVDAEKYKFGERVFCYEFYHQLRCLQDEFGRLEISGEAVKSCFQSTDLESNQTPDILIHNFGKHDNNEVIIEVKTNENSFNNGIKKDFITLDKFTQTNSEFNYKIGISLILNCDFKSILLNNKKLANDLKEIRKDNLRLEVWNIITPAYNEKKFLKEESIITYDFHKLNNVLNPIINSN